MTAEWADELLAAGEYEPCSRRPAAANRPTGWPPTSGNSFRAAATLRAFDALNLAEFGRRMLEREQAAGKPNPLFATEAR